MSAFVLLAFAACATTPSRVPLGGNYALPELADAPKRNSPAAAASDSSAKEPAPSEPAPTALASATPTSSASGTPPDSPTLLRYDPLKVGERAHIDFTLGVSARMEGVPSDLGGGALRVDAKGRVDIKIVKASAQELEQLEVTFTPQAMHTEFNGQSSDSTQDPPTIYDVTASGSSPKISPRSGTLETEDRLTLLVFLAPLLEFHRRWSSSPTFSPVAGYRASIPLSAPAFMTAASDTTKLGPLALSYDGPRTGDRTPFELALPLEVKGDFGKASLELRGSAELGPRARPLTLELSGPCSGSLGPSTAEAIHGEAKISEKLGYD